MTYSEPVRTAARRTRSKILAAVVVVSAALVVATMLVVLPQGRQSGVVGLSSTGIRNQPPPAGPGAPGDPDRGERRDPSDHVGGADGALPADVTVFDTQFPAVAKLDPALLDALHQAAKAAADDGIQFVVNSGWRSEAYQNQLLRDAVAEYGSEEEAARWVATPEKSLHVKGEAIDLAPSDATSWLTKHGSDYGLCQIYDNEPWHYELRPRAAADGCPPRYADPTQDPRMR